MIQIIQPPQNTLLTSPLRHHQAPHVCSHILRGGMFLPFFCTAFPKKVRYNRPEHRPRCRKIAKTVGRPTPQHRLEGRACRKLGGAGSSPKNTSIALDRTFPSLTDITLWNRSALVCRVGHKTSNFTSISTFFFFFFNETAAEINMVTGINSHCRPR